MKSILYRLLSIDQAVENPDLDSENQSPKNVIFGKYEIGKLLGQGTFAKVYKGRNIATGEPVAIKVISKDQVKKAGMMEQITREISVMRLVRHPNVVELKEVMATRARIYFVMEYVKGGELFDKLAKGKLKVESARKYFQQLISAIDYCHSRGVFHRDLKPENLLLDEQGNLKVSDFGLSALPEHSRQDGLLHTQCGTPAYVAPEVLREKGYDGAKADLWSCGVVLFVLIAGYLPFQDENMMKMYRKVFKGEFQFPPWFPPEPRRLVMKLLVVDPNNRLTIQGILRQSWFLKDLKPALQVKIEVPETTPIDIFPTVNETKSTSSSPRFYNAFEFISSMSSGFDLSSLFENKSKTGSMFTSKCSASTIVAKIEAIGKKFNFDVSAKEFKVKMKGRSEGRKGKLTVTVEISEVAPEVAVVEFSKSSGDTFEYVKFCEEDIRPSLKDIVWTWQGENKCN